MVMFMYVSCGFFGASLFGQQTSGNIMVDSFISSDFLSLLLYAGMLLYVSGAALGVLIGPPQLHAGWRQPAHTLQVRARPHPCSAHTCSAPADPAASSTLVSCTTRPQVCFGNAVAQYPLRDSVDILLVGEAPLTPQRTVSVRACARACARLRARVSAVTMCVRACGGKDAWT